MIKVYVDDDLENRPTPEGWVRAVTYHYAISLIDRGSIEVISLDHDLGDFDKNGKEYTGYDILKYILEMVLDSKEIPMNIKIHTANPVGSEKMHGLLADIKGLQEDKNNRS